MMSIRFGNVLNAYNLGKDKSKGLKTPNNRVLYHHGHDKTYIVQGPDDIESVDFLISQRDRFQKENDPDSARRMNNSLYRFLLSKSHLKQTTMENTTETMYELL
jgi:hypothetical protein